MDHPPSSPYVPTRLRLAIALLVAVALVAFAGNAGRLGAQPAAQQATAGNDPVVKQSASRSIAPNSSNSVDAACGPDFSVGGGFAITGASVPFAAHVYDSGPGTPAAAWHS